VAEEKVDETPDIYCNGVEMGISPYDLTIELQLNSPPKEGEKQIPTPVVVGKVRMSLEHAKVFAIILKKNLLTYEGKTGGLIRVHPDLLKGLGVSKEEDW